MSDGMQDSGSYRKAIKDRFSGGESSNSLKNNLGRIGSSISRGFNSIVSGGGESSKGPDYGTGVRQLNNQGHEVYNLDDDCEIFVSKVSDYALFDDPVLEKVSEGAYVPPRAARCESEDTPAEEPEPEEEVDVTSLFANVERGGMSEYTVAGFVSTDGAVEPEAVPRFVENYGTVEDAEESAAESAEEPAALRPEYEVFMNRLRSGTIHNPVRAAPVEEAVSEDVIGTPEAFAAPFAAEAPVGSADVDIEAVIDGIVAETVMSQIAFEEAVDAAFCAEPEAEEPEPEESFATVGRVAGVPAAASFTAFAETSAEAMPAVSAGAVGARSGIDASGEGMPKMSDPQVRRPSSMRFRFDNGILTNVSEEHKEGLQGPLD